LTDAFIDSNTEKVIENAKEMITVLSKVDMSLLVGDAHMEWMKLLKDLNIEIKNISKSKDIDEQRISYASLNAALYSSLKIFGLHEGTVYYQYCPMANGDKGAYWLSSYKPIMNPYFGEDMLKCGETKETLEF
jgi:Cu(I)/Ag(I) efflux system membrane fusion protein